MSGKVISTVVVAALSVVVAASAPPASAQEDAPLVLLIAGDLWTWSAADGSSQQLTFWGYNRTPVISPDGSRIAYESEAQITVEAIERTGGFAGGATPSNIWVWELNTNRAVRIADQPPDASLLVDGVPDKGIARSLPTWSPDGTFIAWTELAFPEMENRLGVFDLTENIGRVMLLDVPEQYGVPSPLEVRWGNGGIAVRSSVYNPNTGGADETILVYDAWGYLRSSTALEMQEGEFPLEFFWVSDGGRPYVGVLYNSGRWVLIDPSNGGVRPPSGALSLFSLTTPAGGIELTLTPGADGRYDWSVVHPDGRADPLGVFTTRQVALSPSGQALALVDYPEPGALSIWRDGALARAEGVGAGARDWYVLDAVWGPVGWRTWSPEAAAADAPGAPVAACEGILPSRLAVGGQGRVITEAANNVRSAPTAAAELVGQIPGGAVFTVLEGPQCAEGIAWWQVDYEGVVGWTAEGEGDTYWLEPLP